jgi:hypothetical protein
VRLLDAGRVNHSWGGGFEKELDIKLYFLSNGED